MLEVKIYHNSACKSSCDMIAVTSPTSDKYWPENVYGEIIPHIRYNPNSMKTQVCGLTSYEKCVVKIAVVINFSF
jgi:hypothetical protein